jgi:CBS domain-containing protein
VLGPAPRPLPAATPLDDVAGALSAAADGEVAVVDADGRPLGALTSTALAGQLTGGQGGENGEQPARVVGDLVEARPTVPVDATIADALDLLDRHDAKGLAVVDDGRLVGWFTARAVLEHLRGHPAGELPGPTSRTDAHTG